MIKRLKAEARRRGLAHSEYELTEHTGIPVGTVASTLARHSEIHVTARSTTWRPGSSSTDSPQNSVRDGGVDEIHGDSRTHPQVLGLQAQGAPSAISQVARLDQAGQIKEAIAFVAGEAEDEIKIRPQLPEAFRHHFAHMEQLRRAAAEANSEAAREARAAARALRQAGLSVHDIGFAMDVSHQRAQQLLADTAP